MHLGPNYQPEYESLADRLLEVAQIRSTPSLLSHVVSRLAERPHIALTRIWLLQPGDRCPTCPFRSRCPSSESCLHLVASAGSPSQPNSPDWTRLDGTFSRVPIGFANVGQVAARGRQVVINDAAPDFQSFHNPEWASRENIHGFNGQPIIHNEDLLGVIAIYTRIPVPPQSPVWLRIFADHIAAALVNARAFEEIERLKSQLELENSYLREEVQEAKALGDILGSSPAIKDMLRRINMVGPTDATVLILGESGTGKELVAREIHRRSQRSQQPLIRVNCASVPRELYESEFFGHVKGAFTGAIKDRAGRFEAADGGTLFLDEVGEIPLELQSKFLRVLQERQYERVGEERTRTINVRLVAATNRNLEEDVADGRFREDLYYRLNVFPIEVAPLRNRRQDIPLLAAHFIDQAARRLKLRTPRITQPRLDALKNYDWPGNVRELQNVIERAVILSQGGDLDFQLRPSRRTTRPASHSPTEPGEEPILTEADFRELEQRNLLAALHRSDWKVHGPGGAAERLGVKPTTLLSRIKALGLQKP